MKTYTIEGMTCGGCVRAVTNALERAGFKATVDLQSATAQIDDSPSTEAVLKAVSDAGFIAQPIPA